MPRRGGRRKKNRTHQIDSENPASALVGSEESKVAKSLVIRRGKCEAIVADLVQDVRHIMMPYTAANFQEGANDRKLTLQKYCQHVCLPMGISHIMAFSQKEDRLTLRIAKTPQGPTLSFRVHMFSLSRHVQKLQRRPININSLMDNSPIVVTNNFGDATAPPQVKLMRITFQNMFPAINVANVQLKHCRRVVLFHLIEEDDDDDDEGEGKVVEKVKNKKKKDKTKSENDDDDDNDNEEKEEKDGSDDDDDDDDKESETETTPKSKPKKKQRIEVRHYAIKATPVGVDKKVRRLIQAKIPNLNKVQDIADYIAGTATAQTNVDAASDSEPEDSTAIVELAQNYTGRGNKSQCKSALKLVELGPRLSLELIKVEQGLSDGNVMYHAHVYKSPQEAKEIQQKVEQRKALKQQRREQQDQNVERKRKAKEEKREAKRKRKEEREKATLEDLRNTNNNNDNDKDDNDESSDEEELVRMNDESDMDDDFDEDGGKDDDGEEKGKDNGQDDEEEEDDDESSGSED